jgi:6-pyruvoyltetrahydropterin/6-carboxytetrahydropterin synthase
MPRYISAKKFTNFSVALRQWKAQHSHCQLLHGYAFEIKVWFASNEPDIDKQLDDTSWIVDYGGYVNIYDKYYNERKYTLCICSY